MNTVGTVSLPPAAALTLAAAALSSQMLILLVLMPRTLSPNLSAVQNGQPGRQYTSTDWIESAAIAPFYLDPWEASPFGTSI